MTEIPPSRWKVVERGRRLEVIDTQASGSGRPLARGVTPSTGSDRLGLTANGSSEPSVASDRSRAMERGAPSFGLPRKLYFDGTLGWTTHPFYDAGGPRAVVLDGALARRFGGVVATLGLLLTGTALVIGADALPILGAVVVIALSSWKQVKPWLTRRLDGIAV